MVDKANDAPAGDGVDATILTITVKGNGSTSFHSHIPTGQSWEDTRAAMEVGMAEFQRQFDDSDKCPVKAAALARPRAAAGEQSREAIARLIDPDAWHETLPQDGCGAYWTARRINALAKADAILALQSPLAKVEK